MNFSHPKSLEVEAAHGCALSDTMRRERNAEPSKPAIDMIESIRAMSDEFRAKLSTAGGDTAAFTQSAIREHLFSKHLKMEPYEQLFQALDEVMSSLSAACTQVLTELENPDAKVNPQVVSVGRVGFER